MALDRCPTCGKTIGTLMEVHPDYPGFLTLWREFLQGERMPGHLLAFIGTVVIVLLVAVAIESYLS